MKTPNKLKAVSISLILLALAGGSAAADSPATTSTTDHSASRPQNGRGAIQGDLQTNQHVYYAGDALDIRVKFARGSEVLAAGDASASIVIFSQDGTVSSVPVPADIGANDRKFFAIPSIDTKTLPVGQYQVALVLTIPKGNPTLVKDWYGGFRGLLDVESIYVSNGNEPGDANKDGEWDNDSDGDGIASNEADKAELHGKKK